MRIVEFWCILRTHVFHEALASARDQGGHLCPVESSGEPFSNLQQNCSLVFASKLLCFYRVSASMFALN